ncbi:MAG TPA: DUF4349 domain-containing protein [Polyangiaceae bacterium]
MTTRTTRWEWRLALLFSCIFALVTSACGGASSEAAAPAKSAVGQPGAEMMLDSAEAAPEAAAPEPPPAEEPMAAPARAPSSLGDESKVAQGGPPRVQTKQEAADVPTPTPGIPPGSESASAPGREPLLIYAATMTLAVFGTRDAIAAVEELARSKGGYLVSRGDETVTIRVPAKAFQSTLGGVSKLGDELHREVNVRDVTEQFADFEIRLKNAEAVRARLEALLAKAGKVEDALAVERELERVTQTIEQLKGRMRLLSELIAYSTITVNFHARPQDQVGSEVRLPFGWLGALGLPPLMNLEAQ